MPTEDELKLEHRHRELSAIALDLASADAHGESIRLRLKEITSGYKQQIDAAEETIERLRAEFAAAQSAILDKNNG